MNSHWAECRQVTWHLSVGKAKNWLESAARFSVIYFHWFFTAPRLRVRLRLPLLLWLRFRLLLPRFRLSRFRRLAKLRDYAITAIEMPEKNRPSQSLFCVPPIDDNDAYKRQHGLIIKLLSGFRSCSRADKKLDLSDNKYLPPCPHHWSNLPLHSSPPGASRFAQFIH